MELYRKEGGVYSKNAGDPGYLTLTGGEPTLHPDFLALVAYFRKKMPGCGIVLLSNGRTFADRAFTARFVSVARPPFSVAIPLHAATERLHDRIAGARGSYRQTMAGLRNLLASPGGVAVEIRVVLHKLNISRLPALLRHIRASFAAPSPARVVLMHYEIEGMSEKNHKLLALRLSRSAALLNAHAGLLAGFPGLFLYHFPLCLLKKELRRLCRVTLPPEERVYPAAKCRGCRLKRRCPGVMPEYLARYGAGELRPGGGA